MFAYGEAYQTVANGSELIEACDPEKEEWRVVIETPKGSRNKYKYADDFGCFQVAKVLPEGMVFPLILAFCLARWARTAIR
jgi:inorganic pyrophosphatase